MREPLISIGIPVWNGENYLAETLDAFLAQDFADFEIVIADNASTDRTEAICREYAAREPRIRYHRQPANYGAAPNYNDVYHRATGKYFKWAAHDDLIAPTFLSECLAVLVDDPGSVAAFTGSISIDADGNELGRSDPRAGLAAPDVADEGEDRHISPHQGWGLGRRNLRSDAALGCRSHPPPRELHR